MRNPLYKMSTAQRIFRYSLGILFVFWCILTVILGYFYVLSTSSQEDEKGGTFVEGVFSQLSYLPYLKTDSQSLFYQNLLFRGCLSSFETDEEGNLARDLCKVYTQDHQNYVVRLLDHPGELPVSELTWSDGHPITIEDVFFTYDEILRTNKW